MKTNMKLDVPSVEQNGKTYVSARYVAAFLEVTVRTVRKYPDVYPEDTVWIKEDTWSGNYYYFCWEWVQRKKTYIQRHERIVRITRVGVGDAQRIAQVIYDAGIRANDGLPLYVTDRWGICVGIPDVTSHDTDVATSDPEVSVSATVSWADPAMWASDNNVSMDLF